MIYGVTHEMDGRPRVTRTITGKVAIGLPPAPGSNFPKRLDHFIFLRKIKNAKNEIEWVKDDELTKHFGENCREFWIVLMDDDPERVCKAEYGAYVKRGCWCRGDGKQAQRRDLGRDGKQWGPFKPYEGPCGEGCPNLNDENNPLPCSPSGDLYFMLADFPTIGSIWRFHTGSYQSIRQLYSAVQDLRSVTGGRLLGVRAKVFLHADRNVYEQGGVTKTGTKWVVGLELAARDLAELQGRMLEAAKAFAHIRGELGGRSVEIEEDDGERGAELTPEFYPAAAIAPAGKVLPPEQTDPDAAIKSELTTLMAKHGLTPAMIEQRIASHLNDLPEFLEKVRTYDRQRHATTASAAGGESRAEFEADRMGQTGSDNAAKTKEAAVVVNKKTEAPQNAAQPTPATSTSAPVHNPQQDSDSITDEDVSMDDAFERATGPRPQQDAATNSPTSAPRQVATPPTAPTTKKPKQEGFGF